ncbi:MAG: hypothetical protein HDS92_01090 [Bacteroidales bacterium]|nr:hypothetical protein [Bacteroidales bacterium]
MGRFGGKSSETAKATRDFIRINPYEIPEKALNLVSNICSKNNTDDANPIIQALKTKLSKKGKDGLDFYEFISSNRRDLYDLDFLYELRTQLSALVQELLAHENTNDTQVVVAGGFSAGKSSFLNTLTGAGSLLPTGIEPCSMVQTYLYCSAKTPEITVKGVNLKDAIVLLDQDVLQSIQHESKSKTYLASVLKKLFVEVPSQNLDGFVFIDTPGYNNSDKKNLTNNSTDEEVALNAINRGNVLLWVIDCGGGTIPKKDLEIIRYFIQGDDNRRIAVIFNKAEKKGNEEIKTIVDSAFSLISDLGDAVIDILGFSSHQNKIYYSLKGYNMPQLLAELRRSGNGNSGVDRCKKSLLELFNDEINYAIAVNNALENEKRELLSQKNEAYKILQNETEGTKEYVKVLSGILVDNYDQLIDTLDKLSGNGADTLNTLQEGLEAIYHDELGKAVTHDSVLTKIRRCYDQIDGFINKHNRIIEYNYFNTDYRKEWVGNIKVQLERVDEGLLRAEYDRLEDKLEAKNQEIKKFRTIKSEMERYRDLVMATLQCQIKEFRDNAHKVQDARLDVIQSTDVFTAIHLDSYSDFINCIIKGVKHSETNPEGYTPLTYAVKMNRPEMVKFLMEHNARPGETDGRGMTAFLTAVENVNAGLMNYLIKSDATLANDKSAQGESAMEIAEKNGIGKWYKLKIHQS